MNENALDPVQTAQETMLLALSPDELQGAHAKMRSWARSMAKLMAEQCDQFKQAFELARNKGWGNEALKTALRGARKRHEFYTKILAALDAGFVVVPNFRMTPWIVRVRANAQTPAGPGRESPYSVSRWFPQNAASLPVGEGRYVAHAALAESDSVEVDDGKGGKKTIHRAWPTEFDESPEFPLMFAAPYVMDRTSEAVKALLFDEIGIAHDDVAAGRGDPILLGRILNPRRGRPNVTFFIAWSMDLRRL